MSDEETNNLFEQVRGPLAAEKQVAITDVARKFGLNDDDPLWALVAALDLHNQFSQSVPVALRAAGEHAAAAMEIKLVELAEIVGGMTQKAEESRAAIKSAAEAGAIAAMRAAVASLPTDKIVGEVTGKIGAQIADQKISASRAYWGALSKIITGVIVIACLSVGAALGWLFKPAPTVTFSPQLSASAECSRSADQALFCKLRGQK